MANVFVNHISDGQLVSAAISKTGKILKRQSQAARLSSGKTLAGQLRSVGKLLLGSQEPARIGLAAPYVAGDELWFSFAKDAKPLRLSSVLRKSLGRAPVIQSAVRAALVGEQWLGEARKKQNVVLLRVGQEISAAVMLEGKLYNGTHDLAASAAWMAISEADGDEIRRYGGLQTLASTSALVHAAQGALEAGFGGNLGGHQPDQISFNSVCKAARRRDPLSQQLFHRLGRLLGLAAANFISLFDPEVVIISGPLIEAFDLYWKTLQETALARCHPLLANKVEIRLSKLGDDAILVGLARLAVGESQSVPGSQFIAHS